MSDTEPAVADQRPQEPRRPVVDERDGDERQPEAERVGDQQERALERPCSDVAAIVRMPPRMMPMHGVQPMAKIAPEPERREPAAARADEPAAEPVAEAGPSPAPPVRGRSSRSRSRGAGRAGIERPPGALERRDRAGCPARFRPRTIRTTPPIDAERRQVVDERAGRERGRDAEQREHGPEAGDVGERVAQGRPARRPGAVGSPPRRRSRVSWPR